jgi:hypothetical protein
MARETRAPWPGKLNEGSDRVPAVLDGDVSTWSSADIATGLRHIVCSGTIANKLLAVAAERLEAAPTVSLWPAAYDETDVEEETGEPWAKFPPEALEALGYALMGMQQEIYDDAETEHSAGTLKVEPRYIQRALSHVIQCCLEVPTNKK